MIKLALRSALSRPRRRGQDPRRRRLGLRRAEDQGRREGARRPRYRRQGAGRGRRRRRRSRTELPQPPRGAVDRAPASSTPTTCCATTASCSRTRPSAGAGEVIEAEEGRCQEGRRQESRAGQEGAPTRREDAAHEGRRRASADACHAGAARRRPRTARQPEGLPIKGNADSMLYHVPGGVLRPHGRRDLVQDRRGRRGRRLPAAADQRRRDTGRRSES